MDFGFNRRGAKHARHCDWCGSPFGRRKYVNTLLNRAFCSEEHEAEGQAEAAQRANTSILNQFTHRALRRATQA